jgi:hypothetical protein
LSTNSHLFVAGFTDAGGANFTNYRDEWRNFTTALATISQVPGAEIPPGVTAVMDRYAAFVEHGNRVADRVAAEVVEPTGLDLALLRAAALAEETGRGDAIAAVNQVVQDAALRKAKKEYAPAAKGNYRIAARALDSTAKDFVELAKVIDPEAKPEVLADGTAAQVEAYRAQPAKAGQLEARMSELAAAAVLSGARGDIQYFLCSNDQETIGLQISLVVDAKGCNRREITTGFSNTGRCGRWSALHAAGAKIRAADNPLAIEPYAPPSKPIAVYGPDRRLKWHDRHSGDVPPGHVVAQYEWMDEVKDRHAIP